MRGVIIITFITLFCIILVNATPVIEYQVDLDGYSCEQFKVIEKNFRAESESIDLGILCPTNSRVELYDCSSGECSFVDESYKVNGELPKYSNFEVGKRYQYQCHACEGTCVIEVEEGEKVDLHQSLFGLSFELLSSRAPLSADATWTTGFEDAGIYDTTITLLDDHEDDTASFCILVKDENRAPVIVSVSNEGDSIGTNAVEGENRVGINPPEEVPSEVVEDAEGIFMRGDNLEETNNYLVYLVLLLLFIITVFRVRKIKKRRKKHSPLKW